MVVGVGVATLIVACNRGLDFCFGAQNLEFCCYFLLCRASVNYFYGYVNLIRYLFGYIIFHCFCFLSFGYGCQLI